MNQFNNHNTDTTVKSTEQQGNSKFLKRVYLIISLILLISGTAIFVLEIPHYNEYKELSDGGCYTQGEITSVTSEYVDTNAEETDVKYHIKGSYIVDGEKYNFQLESDKPAKKGNSIKLFYEKDNPSHYVQENFPIDDFVIGGFCVGISVLLGYFAYKPPVTKKKSQYNH